MVKCKSILKICVISPTILPLIRLCLVFPVHHQPGLSYNLPMLPPFLRFLLSFLPYSQLWAKTFLLISLNEKPQTRLLYSHVILILPASIRPPSLR